MEEKNIINPDLCYLQAEQQAEKYFELLNSLVSDKSYVPSLTKDFQWWKQKHIQLQIFLHKKKKVDAAEYHNYIRWLNYTGKLDQYLDRSISYIYMRDLGKDLHLKETRTQIKRVTANLKEHLKKRGAQSDDFSMAGLYRWAQKEGIETAIIWLQNKLKTVSANIPKGMDAVHAERKLIKIVAGVVMHVLDEMDDDVSPDKRANRLDTAVRLGYSYGLTYPFIDDLLDSNVLSAKEKEHYSDLIRTTLVTGTVPKLGRWAEENAALIHYVHSELLEAFEYIKKHQRQAFRKSFLEQAYVFFHSQHADRVKNLSNAHYTNEELFIPIIIKSASSRLIARSILSTEEDEGFDSRTFYYGIYNQLADDFSDLFDDLDTGAVTPYTYYWKYHNMRPDLINPFELYWAVITYLIHNVYQSDSKVCEVILDRAINSLKRFKVRMGTKKYNEVMERFAFENQKFFFLIQKMVRKASDVDFFDKLLRDHMITVIKNENREREEFLDTIEKIRREMNEYLRIPENKELPEECIIEAANYSLEGNGKRLRPIITWFMGVKKYGLKGSAIKPLLKSLEYMHTASLIFDDLPAQDNASVRRGRSTLHKRYTIATAELTGLFLTQKAIEEQAALHLFDTKAVLQLIQYSAQITADLCRGQAMDLESKGKPLTQEQLNLMCHYKTGLAFEASLIMPAILAGADEKEMAALKNFARHAGIAFQIKDDLLDVEGDMALLGKPIGQDAANNNTTFVSILGLDGAKKEMWNHYCLALETLKEIPGNTIFLKYLMDYMVNREK
ncbi:polyprenyl synthetase family protein [Neobacillus mesonae]|uniref:polyprenyl synthetase family protein n=1 Tax=Neobacillus mesonae TaxID=1193713 RepID=UPI00204057EA|nr:polyprenyl synthetase family protein [Neobacillus mesonae]MCM3569501.1 polyprenyl synthetase family protein [Neobacillus mesonae]